MSEREPITARIREEERQEAMANIGRPHNGARRSDVLSYAESKERVEAHLAFEKSRAIVNHGQAAARDFVQASRTKDRMRLAAEKVRDRNSDRGL